jgi:hypothetical protein
MVSKGSGLRFKGRNFGSDELDVIRDIVGDYKRLSRQELANTVCELLDWKRPNGGLKTREACELLERLDAAGQIALPSASSRGRPRGSKTKIELTEASQAQAELYAQLREVEPVRLCLVETAEQRRQWRELVERYHPEGCSVPVGAHLRYLVEISFPSPQIIGCLQLSSPAWKMKARDEFIGWSAGGHRSNLQRVVNNSRFLIVPWVHVEHLASRVLGRMAQQFPADWERAYGIRPLLLETVVSAEHEGTCYRAANWKALGQTTGRGRMDRRHRGAQHGKQQVFVYPLEKDTRQRLCQEAVVPSVEDKSTELADDKGRDRQEFLEEKRLDIGKRYELLKGQLDERGRRCWLGCEALAMGRGGLSLVAEACAVSLATVKAGMSEVQKRPSEDKGKARIRRKGGGRKSVEERKPEIVEALEKLVDPYTRGDPESPLRWTSKSHQHLADELTAQGYVIGADTVRKLLLKLDYRLKANRKTREGKQHPDRDAQFQYIAQKSQEFLDAGDPVISVDTKKKEKIGNYKNGGREYEPKGHVEEVETHDFGQRDDEGRVMKGIPYGVYDQGRNEGWVSVGTDHDTAPFAVSTIGQWWGKMGRPAYPNSGRVLITADSGGSNGSRIRAWKIELQRLSDATGLEFHVSHFPPGTSKWNKIEHRMFSQITMNWRGRPLTSYETIINLIANTKTKKGLRIEAVLDTSSYPTGIKITDKQLGTVNMERDDFQPNWNYTILPSSIQK